MQIPAQLFYTKDHEWALIEGTKARMGITDHAQSSLGDITFVDLPKAGAQAEGGKFCATVESVKAASDVYAPVSGKIIQVNDALSEHPELINQSPYEKGWFAVIEMNNPSEKNKLMTAPQYEDYLKALK